MTFSTLELVYPRLQETDSKKQTRWLEYLVDGRPLSKLVDRGGHIGAFGWLDRRTEGLFARWLLLEVPSVLPEGRVPLYVCSECGDLGCGAVTVSVEKTPESFVWRDLGWANDDGSARQVSVAGYELHFDRAAYVSVFRPRR